MPDDCNQVRLDPATALYRDMVGSAVQAHGRSDTELVEEIRRKYADKPDIMELCRRFRRDRPEQQTTRQGFGDTWRGR